MRQFRSDEDIYSLLISSLPELRYKLIGELANETEHRLLSAKRDDRHFFLAAAQALNRLPSYNCETLSIKCLLNCADYFYRFGESFSAIPLAEQARSVAKLAEITSDECRTNNILGFLYQDTGNLPRAFECLETSLRLAQQLNDRPAKCSAWVNIAGAFLGLGFTREAIECSERAINVSWSQTQSERTQHSRFLAQSNIVLAALHQGDFNRGLLAAGLGLRDSSVANPIQLLIFEKNSVQLLLSVNAIAQAKQHFRSAYKSALQLKSIRADLQTTIAQGLLEAAMQKPRAAITHLHEALEMTQQHRPAYIDAVSALAWAYRALGRRGEVEKYQRLLRNHYGDLHCKATLQAARRFKINYLQKRRSGATRRRKLWTVPPRNAEPVALQALLDDAIQAAVQFDTSRLAKQIESVLSQGGDALLEDVLVRAQESELAMTLRHSAEAVSEQAEEWRLFALPLLWQFSEPVANALVKDCLSLFKPQFSEDLTLHTGCLSYLELSRTPLSRFYQACRGADFITAAPAPPALRSRIYLRYLVGRCTTHTALNELQHTALTHIRTCLQAIDADLRCASLTPQASFFHTLYHAYQVYTLRRMAEIAVKVPARHPVEVHLSSQRMVNEAVVDFGKRTPRYRLFGRPAESAASYAQPHSRSTE